jgi:hypothetical protein
VRVPPWLCPWRLSYEEFKAKEKAAEGALAAAAETTVGLCSC